MKIVIVHRVFTENVVTILGNAIGNSLFQTGNRLLFLLFGFAKDSRTGRGCVRGNWKHPTIVLQLSIAKVAYEMGTVSGDELGFEIIFGVEFLPADSSAAVTLRHLWIFSKLSLVE